MDDNRKKPHIYLGRTGKAESYTSTAGPPTRPDIPARNRQRHGTALMAQLQTVTADLQQLSTEAEAYDLESRIGIQVEFQSFPGVELAVQSLSDARHGVELMNVRADENRIYATVFVPEGNLNVIEGKIQAYLKEKKDRNGHARDNRPLIDAIQSFRSAALTALWTDSPALFPEDENEALWWEVWLPVRGDRQAMIHDFRRLAQSLGINVGNQVLELPERSILLASGTRSQFSRSGLLLSCMSEIRMAKETAAFFDELSPAEQPQWANDLLSRLQQPGDDSTCVCILDTGVNSGNPLLGPFLTESDHYVVDPSWSVADHNGHGSGMAGLAAWGDLAEPLAGSDPVQVSHRLESVKLLRSDGGNRGRHFGVMTSDAVALPEISKPNRKRVFAMAVTTEDGRDRGRPSAWSSALDSLAADYLGEGDTPRLLTVAAGNIQGGSLHAGAYCTLNEVSDIHDPGQAWNALTIGAYTEKTDTSGLGYTPLAQSGEIAPWSTTSVSWDKAAPIKPEVVFEGGNVGVDQHGCFTIPSLSLLTTYHQPLQRIFTTFEATSAATAVAGRFAAFPHASPSPVRHLARSDRRAR